MVQRKFFLDRIIKQFQVNRIVALLGPRQCGKTTLAKQYLESFTKIPKSNYFDLENPVDLQRLNAPVTAIEPLNGLIVIDEIQRQPNLFQTLRYLHDEQHEKQFLILGSASRDLIQQTSESLAGRISYIELPPFLAIELAASDQQKLWIQGGFPRSFLADADISYAWRHEYIRTYIERDIPALGVHMRTENFRQFWYMLSHYHGQLFNAAEIANSLQISSPTCRSYLNLLQDTFMVRVLKPWFSNIGKRQVKSSKIYLRDSGIYHSLLGIQNQDMLLTSPKLGASWEGFALEQIIQKHQAHSEDCYFWATHNQAELDLLIVANGKKLGFEFKYCDAPKLTPSMKIAQKDLELDCLTVIYPGNTSYILAGGVKAIGLKEFLSA